MFWKISMKMVKFRSWETLKRPEKRSWKVMEFQKLKRVQTLLYKAM